MKTLWLLMAIPLLLACESQYGIIDKKELAKLKSLVKGCIPGEVKEVQAKDGKGFIFVDKYKTVLISITLYDDQYPQIMFSFDDDKHRTNCLQEVWGDKWEAINNALAKRVSVIATTLEGMPAFCYPPSTQTRLSFYCFIGYSMYTAEEVNSVKEGICEEINKKLSERGARPLSCVEVL